MSRFSLLLLLLACRGVDAADSLTSIPLPEISVTRTLVAPNIDGVMSEGEWDAAAAGTAFTRAFKAELSEVQTVFWVTFDDTHLYVCMKNYRGEKYRLLKKRGRDPDEDAIVFDTSNEIWITPPANPPETYQTLFNTYPGVFDVKMIPSVGYNAKSWNGNWEIAASETRDHWIIEARAPFRSFGHEGVKNGDRWRALFCTDALGGAGFTAWARGGGFAEINRHGWLSFRADSPVFQFLDVESIFTGNVTLLMAVQGKASEPATVDVSVRFGGDVEPSEGDLVLKKSLRPDAGQRIAFDVHADLEALDLPEDGGIPQGYCEVTARSEGQRLYRHVFPFSLTGFRRSPPADIIASPYQEPIGVTGNYAPLNKKLMVRVDRLYCKDRERLSNGTARLIDPASGEAVAERKIAPFIRDYSRFAMDLKQLQVPIETEEAWGKNKPTLDRNEEIRKENKRREAQGQRSLPMEPLPVDAAEYTLRIELTDDAGERNVRTDTPVRLRGYEFEWLPNDVGISDAAIPPWQPVKWDGHDTLEMWNKRYRMNSLGLASRVINGSRSQLDGAMKMIATVDGRDAPVRTGDLMLTKIKEAYAELRGFASAPGLRLQVDSRIEMDGCVLNTMRIFPEDSRTIDGLSMIVSLPKTEAECFVTTSGGWSSTFGWTPERWDSRETSSGSLQGNFVPFVFLTNSDRGFCWFADNERGWLLDPAKPTIELEGDEQRVHLRVNFINRSGPITEPTTIRYGWMTTPQKPQPVGWRTWKIDYRRPFPETQAAFYGMNQTDWAVLWPYYASPYPWDYEKSKVAFDRARDSGLVLAAGNIAHAIARYRDYKGRWFNEVAADWGMEPGNLQNGNVALSRGPNDFRLWHWDRWIRESGLNGLYFDETYLNLDRNFLTGGAYLMPDERIQPGYNFLGLRSMCWRLRYLFHQHGLEGPRLWFHTSANHPVHAWLPDIGMEGENVEPTGLDNDYMECLPASRLRAIGMGRNLGIVPLIMCQADRHWDDNFSPFCVPQMVGWVLAHDCLPENSPFWDVLAVESKIGREDVCFRPYWKSGQGIECSTEGVLVSAHSRPGHSLLWLVNTARADRRAEVDVDLKSLDLGRPDPRRPLRLIDAETGEAIALRISNGRGAFSVDVPARFWRAVRIIQTKRLLPRQTLSASFDLATAKADESIGYGGHFGKPLPADAFVPGKAGRGIELRQSVSYLARHHVRVDAGRIEWCLQFDPAADRGTVFNLGGLALDLNRGKYSLKMDKEVLQQWDDELPSGRAWRDIAVMWQGNRLEVKIGDQRFPVIVVESGMPIKPQSRGLEIYGGRNRAKLSTISLGPMPEAIIDDVRMGQ